MRRFILFASIIATIILVQSIAPSFANAKINLDLVWEAQTFIPPTYDGKPLATQNSQITINIIPLNNDLLKKIYIYNWYITNNPQGYRLQPDKSGPGKQSFAFFNTFTAKNVEIDLEIIDPDSEDIIYAKSIKIPISKPEVKIYQSSALKEKFTFRNSQIKTTLASNNEIIYYFKAVPFFFNAKNSNQIDYVWAIDSEPAEYSNFLELKIKKGNTQSSILKTISVRATRQMTPFQSAEQSFSFQAQ